MSETGKAEAASIRDAQATAVMPLIGPLLDSWECSSQSIREEHPELDKQLRHINRAMEDAGEAASAPVGAPSEREMKLDLLIKSMQADAVQYLIPDGGRSAGWFVNRMLARLDGPQQREAQAVQAAPVGALLPAVDSLTDLIAQMLNGVYYCGRVWEAWGVGTMSEDDFSPAGETDIPREIATAVLLSLSGASPAEKRED